MTALSGTGAVLADGLASGGKAEAPGGTSFVVVGHGASGDLYGWELSTPLLDTGAGTLLAPGACLHPSRPWTPAARYGRAGAPCWVPAARLSAEVEGITTTLTLDPQPPTAVVVRLDRLRRGASVDDVEIEIEGAPARPRSTVVVGERIELVLPVGRPQRGAGSLAVTVRPGEDWRLAGVLGVRGGATRWTRTLRERRHARFQPVTAVDAGRRPPRVVLRALEVGRPR